MSTAALDGKARGVMYYFRTADRGLIPADCTLEDTKRAAAAVREEDYAAMGFDPARLPGLRLIVAALRLSDIPKALEYIARLKAPVATDDFGILARLGLEALK